MPNPINIIILVALAVLLVATPATAQEWTEVARFEGSGLVQTESFAVEAPAWRVRWEVPEGSDGFLSVTVRTDEGRLVTTMGAQDEIRSASSMVRADTGSYFLDVNSHGVSWVLVVEVQR